MIICHHNLKKSPCEALTATHAAKLAEITSVADVAKAQLDQPSKDAGVKDAPQVIPQSSKPSEKSKQDKEDKFARPADFAGSKLAKAMVLGEGKDENSSGNRKHRKPTGSAGFYEYIQYRHILYILYILYILHVLLHLRPSQTTGILSRCFFGGCCMLFLRAFSPQGIYPCSSLQNLQIIKDLEEF